MSSKKTWDFWELIAIRYLQKHWYIIKETNFKFSRFWEIDVIAFKDDITSFIEVKYRNSTFYGEPEESIIKTKLWKCRKTLEYYCKINNVSFDKIRFDVVTILKWNVSYRIRHYKNVEI